MSNVCGPNWLVILCPSTLELKSVQLMPGVKGLKEKDVFDDRQIDSYPFEILYKIYAE